MSAAALIRLLCICCLRRDSGYEGNALFFLYGAQLNIAAFPARLQLNARVLIVPHIADRAGVVAVHGILHCLDRFAVIFLRKRLTLKRKVFCGRQRDDIETLRHRARIFHTSQPTSSQYGK